jgi:hypothetical protein
MYFLKCTDNGYQLTLLSMFPSGTLNQATFMSQQCKDRLFIYYLASRGVQQVNFQDVNGVCILSGRTDGLQSILILVKSSDEC